MERFWWDGALREYLPIDLGAEAEDAVVFGAGLSGETFDYLFLEHDDGTCEGRGAREKVFQDGTAAGVRQVSQEFDRAVFKEFSAIEFSAIGMMDFDGRVILEALFEGRGEASIELDEDDAAAIADEVLGEGASAWADFDDGIGG